MKKFSILLVLIVMLLSLVGCKETEVDGFFDLAIISKAEVVSSSGEQ